jgi:alkylresorcinol/alkylpyrone synthase
MASKHAMPPLPVSLLGIGTAVPETVLEQTQAEAVARDLFGSAYPDYARLAAVFRTSGIRKRHLVRPVDWYRTPRGWPERTAAYLEGAGALFEQSALKALAQANLEPRDIDAVVTVSSTGIATPSLEVRSFTRLGFRSSTRRYPVLGLGCAGGVSGLAIAADIARGRLGWNGVGL